MSKKHIVAFPVVSDDECPTYWGVAVQDVREIKPDGRGSLILFTHKGMDHAVRSSIGAEEAQDALVRARGFAALDKEALAT